MHCRGLPGKPPLWLRGRVGRVPRRALLDARHLHRRHRPRGHRRRRLGR